MKQNYSVKSGVSVNSQAPSLSLRSNMMSPLSQTGLFSRQGILQRKPKANIQDKNYSLMVSACSGSSFSLWKS